MHVVQKGLTRYEVVLPHGEILAQITQDGMFWKWAPFGGWDLRPGTEVHSAPLEVLISHIEVLWANGDFYHRDDVIANLEHINDRTPQCRRKQDGDCALHGSRWTPSGCLTLSVAEDVVRHRAEQFARYGANRDIVYGTGPGVAWIPTLAATATSIERLFRTEWDYDDNPAPSEHTWMRMLREEVAEVFAQDDPKRMEEELIQVAALAVSWIEKIRERRRRA